MMNEHVERREEQRIVERIDLKPSEIKRILKDFQLTLDGSKAPQVAGEGRIASNLIVDTREKGKVIVRLYPETYSQGRVGFEVDALLHFARGGICVPQPLVCVSSNSGSDHKHIRSADYMHIVVYPIIAGKTLTQSELDVNIAGQAGELLAKMINVSRQFKPEKNALRGDVEFILGLLRNMREQNIEFSSHCVAADMEDVLLDVSLQRKERSTPQGIVHADFFFENTLVDDSQRIKGVLDFGDAYYGSLLNDILIGGMEFSVLEGEVWNMDMLESFLQPHGSFLVQEKITEQDCMKVLLANCVRFAVYTIPFTREDGDTLDENPYIKRFYAIQKTETGELISQVIRNVIERAGK